MSKEVIPALGGNALSDDLAGQAKVVKITSQAVVDLIAQGHEVIATHGSGPQVGMISQAFEAAVKTKARSPMLPMSVCVALSQGYIGYDLQNALGEKLLSCSINKPVATLVTRAEIDANDPTFLSPARPIGSFFTEQEAELLTKQGYTLKEGAGRDYCRVVASPKPADIIEKETVKALVDAGQVVITVGGGDIPVTRESNHLRGASAIINKDWASVRLTEMIDTNILVTLTAVEKVAINFGRKNGQWLNRLSPGDAEHFIEEGHFTKGSTLLKVEAAASSTRSRAGHEALVTVLSKAKEEIEGKTGTAICQ